MYLNHPFIKMFHILCKRTYLFTSTSPDSGALPPLWSMLKVAPPHSPDSWIRHCKVPQAPLQEIFPLYIEYYFSKTQILG